MFGIFKRVKSPPMEVPQWDDANAVESIRLRTVLNVGGNNKAIPLPGCYDGWGHDLLDIDPAGSPDIVCDARDMTDLPEDEYDSVYCSHNLEHYHSHDVRKVLSGFLYVLKEGGFAYIRVPDMEELMKNVVANNLDIDDFLYDSPAGPITVKDVIYGLGREIEGSGNDFFAHKTGFTKKSLTAVIDGAGFSHVFTHAGNLEVTAIAFKGKPHSSMLALLDIPEALIAETGMGEESQRPQGEEGTVETGRAPR